MFKYVVYMKKIFKDLSFLFSLRNKSHNENKISNILLDPNKDLITLSQISTIII